MVLVNIFYICFLSIHIAIVVITTRTHRFHMNASANHKRHKIISIPNTTPTTKKAWINYTIMERNILYITQLTMQILIS